MNIPTPGLFPSGDLKKDGYALFTKFVRTKDVDVMEENFQRTSRQDKIKLQVKFISKICFDIILVSQVRGKLGHWKFLYMMISNLQLNADML